jgi:hypothetical protein
MILVAPFAVGFSAYLNVAGRLDLRGVLFYLAVFMLTVLLPKLVRLRCCSRFHTSWWAVSFPLAAMTLAALKFSIEQRVAGTGIRTRHARFHDLGHPVAGPAHEHGHRPGRTARIDALTLTVRC